MRRTTKSSRGGERKKAARQALWRVHTNHPHFNVEYENDDNDNDDDDDDDQKEKVEEGEEVEGRGRKRRRRWRRWRRRRGSMVCSRCSWDGIRERGCMLGIRRRGHYKELWGPASYVSILASVSLATLYPPTIHPFIVLSLSLSFFPYPSVPRILIHKICSGS